MKTTRRVPALLMLLAFLRPFAGQVVLSVLLGAATISAGIGLLGTSAYLIASAALHPSVAALQVAIVGVRFFGISRAVFRYLERLVSHSVNFRLLAGLRVWFYQRLEPLAPARLQDTRSADLLSRAIADIETLENFYVRAVAPPVVALIIVIGMGWFMGRYDARLTWVLGFALLAVGAGLPVLVHRLARVPGRDVVDRRSALAASLLDLIQGMPDLMIYGQAGSQLERIRQDGVDLQNAQKRLGRVGALGNAVGLFITGLALWGVLVIAIPLTGQLISGVDLAVLSLVTLASFEAVTPLTLAAQHLESSLQSGRRLFSLVDRSPQVSAPQHPANLSAGRLDLRIRGLTFRYDGETTPALVDFDLDLPSGKRVALVGSSGAGKTTLINLLLRFWDVDRGVMEINGLDIHEYAVEDVRSLTAVISQNTYLFAGTLRQNLLLANPTAAPEILDRVLLQSQLVDLVAGLPNGLDTWVGERGLNLSGGERQRVAIARALLRDAPLLLLDEPTANLDAAAEQAILRTLQQVSMGRSLISITHRLVGLYDMDEIIVLRQGRVAERGTHAALLASRGIYAQLWEIQAESLR
jgi:ATP-binding cassette subfamily C protein CydC